MTLRSLTSRPTFSRQINSNKAKIGSLARFLLKSASCFSILRKLSRESGGAAAFFKQVRHKCLSKILLLL